MSSKPARGSSAGFIAALILLSISVWLPRLQGPLDLRYDAGVYYVLGTSLAEGNDYRLLNEPGEIRAVQYPPALPAVVAGIQLVAGTSDPAVVGYWLRLMYFGIFVAFILTAYALGARYLPRGFAFLASLVVLLHKEAIWMSELLFSELPYALVSMLLLLVATRQRTPPRVWLSGLLGAMAVLIRSTGIALLAAWIGESLLKHHYRQMALRVVLALLPIVAWQGYTIAVKSSDAHSESSYEYQRAAYQFYNVTYAENFAYVDSFVPELGFATPVQMGRRVVINMLDIPGSVGQTLSAPAEWSRNQLGRINELISPLRLPLWIVNLSLTVLGLLSLAGLVILAVRGELLLPLYAVGSFGLISLTPWPGQFIRYLMPIAPILSLALFLTLHLAWSRSKDTAQPWLRPFTGVVLVGICLGIFTLEGFALWKVFSKLPNEELVHYEDYDQGRHSQRMLFYPSEWRLHDEALAWLKDRAQLQDIVATSTPHWFYLKSGIKSVLPPFEPDTGKAQRLLESVPIRYLIVDSLEFVDITRRYALPAVEAFPERWELVFSTGDSGSQIFRLRDSAGNTQSPLEAVR